MLAVLVIFVVLSAGKNDTAEVVSVAGSDNQKEKIEGLNSIKNLIANGENLECTFNDTSDPNVRSSGTVYITGNRFRVNNERVEVDASQTNSSIIYDESNVFAWSSGAQGTFGFTFAIPPEEIGNEDGALFGENEDGSVSLDQEYDFSCMKWNVDESMFVPPAGVEFFDPAKAFEAYSF